MAQIYNQVKVATTANVVLSTSISPGVTTIDGVIVNADDRVLVKAQSNKVQNGIYTISSLGAWQRASDFDTATLQDPGGILFVTQGNTFADTGWIISSDAQITVGVTQIEFERISLNLKVTSGDIPSSIVLRSVKGRALTNNELDNNFKFLSTELSKKVNDSDFNGQTIATKLNTLTFTQSNLNANLLRGVAPSQAATGLTIAQRDSSGNLTATTFVGNLQGNAATTTLAATATVALNVSGVVSIANGGTGSNTAEAARIALNVLNKAGDQLTGKLIFTPSNASRASLRILTGEAPTSPDDGDIWLDSAHLHYRLNSITRKIADLDSPIFTGAPLAPTPGTSSNNGSIATTQFVRAVKTTEIDPAIALKANIASPTLTGDPKAPTASTSNISTSIANTQFVKDYLDSRLSTYDKWGTSRKFVQSTDPGAEAVNGDFWFKI